MEEDRLAKLLQHFDTRVTPVRLLIIEALEGATAAMSLTDLETELKTVDKSSISRNLHLFLEAGLIHQIQDGSGITKYAISQSDDSDLPCNHAHFTCKVCGETICLDDLTLDTSQLTVPAGYRTDGYTLVLKGVCPNCQNKHHP